MTACTLKVTETFSVVAARAWGAVPARSPARSTPSMSTDRQAAGTRVRIESMTSLPTKEEAADAAAGGDGSLPAVRAHPNTSWSQEVTESAARVREGM
nr:hypothetical protein StreXyl84_67500 [Streptomyces sp. Xyl84]